MDAAPVAAPGFASGAAPPSVYDGAEGKGLALVRVILLALVATLLLGVSPSARPLQRWEHGGAQLQLNRVRMLTERLSKQNLLYHLRLAGEQRSSLVDTAEQLDAALVALVEGSPRLGVPAPPTLEIRGQIEELDSVWGALRNTAVASPYEYARRAAERGVTDPFGIRYFALLAADVDRQAVVVSNAYLALCERQPRQDCRAVASATASGMLSERLMKQFVLVVTGMDVRANAALLRQSRDGLDRTLVAVEQQEPVQATLSSERGKPGVVAAGIWSDIQGTWKALRVDVDRVIAGESDQVVLGDALTRQHDFLRDLQRLSVAVRRFAAARRAAGKGPPQ